MFSVLALAGSAAAFNATNGTNSTTTVQSTDYVTIPCESTTLTYGGSTYTVSEATTLTVEDCSCTDNSAVPTAAPTGNSTAPSSSAVLGNGAGAVSVGAAAGVVAAVAYLL